jgi:hypothetical protein
MADDRALLNTIMASSFNRALWCVAVMSMSLAYFLLIATLPNTHTAIMGIRNGLTPMW